MTFDLLRQGQICFPMYFVWALYIYMGKMLRIHILDISIIQLNPNLMMSIRALSRHKIAKWADEKSKMASTAAILKINFRHNFPNLWSLWAKTCSVATGWLLDRNELKLCRPEIQDGHNGSAPLNKMASRAKNRNYSNDILSLANDLISIYICTGVFLQWPSSKIAKIVLLGWIKWQPELKIEKKKHLKKSLQPVSRVQNIFTEVFLIWHFTKIAKIVPLGWIKWPPELKVEKKKKKTFKRHLLLGQWPDFNMIT